MYSEILDDVIDKAKNLYETTKKKTGETVSIEKMKFAIASLNSKKEREFNKLGKIYYEELKNIEIEDVELKAKVDRITDINEDIDDLKKKIALIKAKRVCPACGAFMNEKDAYCPACGTKVVFDSSED